ncbi:unnamed protein product, partial [marine sediment metagenome]
MKGVVKFIHSEGWGFIIAEDKSEIYFHHTDFIDREEAKTIKAEDELEYEIGEGKKGNKAINIKKIEKKKN